VAGLLSYIVFVGFMFLFASEGYATWDEDTSAQGLVGMFLILFFNFSFFLIFFKSKISKFSKKIFF